MYFVCKTVNGKFNLYDLVMFNKSFGLHTSRNPFLFIEIRTQEFYIKSKSHQLKFFVTPQGGVCQIFNAYKSELHFSYVFQIPTRILY